MNSPKTLIRTLAVLALIAGAAAIWVLAKWHSRPDIESYRQLMIWEPVSDLTPVRVIFLGVSTLLFDDGKDSILIDGFFTRPEVLAVATGKISPNTAIIESTLARLNIKRLASIIVTHAHYDHALDAAEIAKGTDALLIGSNSVMQIAKGAGLDPSRTKLAEPEREYTFGQFKVALLPARHVPSLFSGGMIESPLVPPAKASDYKEGETFSVMIHHPAGRFLIQSSAGFKPSALSQQRADVVFLGIGMLGKQSDSYLQDYWNEVVSTVQAKRVIPIHWDDFTLPLSQDLQPMPALIDDFDRSMSFLKSSASKTRVDLKLMRSWVPVNPMQSLTKSLP